MLPDTSYMRFREFEEDELTALWDALTGDAFGPRHWYPPDDEPNHSLLRDLEREMSYGRGMTEPKGGWTYPGAANPSAPAV